MVLTRLPNTMNSATTLLRLAIFALCFAVFGLRSEREATGSERPNYPPYSSSVIRQQTITRMADAVGAILLSHYLMRQKINVLNRARAGRSSRTFITEGVWEKVLADMKPGDFVG